MPEKNPDLIAWGTLHEKRWLRDMMKKRDPKESLAFLQKYKASCGARTEWGRICPKSIQEFTNKLIRECQTRLAGVQGDNTRL